MDRDLVDAKVILALVSGMREWETVKGEKAPRKPLREALWYYWQEPRMPVPRVRGKHPFDYPWTSRARRRYVVDPSCRLVIDHAEPISLVIEDLLTISNLRAMRRRRNVSWQALPVGGDDSRGGQIAYYGLAPPTHAQGLEARR